MRRAACPGSFDPVTSGHLDVIERAAQLHDELFVVVGHNQSKARLFTVDERVQMLEAVTAHLDNVRVEAFTGLLVDYCRSRSIPVLVKGLRTAADFDYELTMAQLNGRLTGVETVFIPTRPEHGFLSSSLIKDIAAGGGDLSGLVPAPVADRLQARRATDQPRP